MIRTVTVYIFKDDEVLLLFRNKKKIDINKGKYIGVGGHIEEGETPIEAAEREVKEETGFEVNNLEYRCHVEFHYDNFEEEMHVFTTKEFYGEMIKCDEGDLSWQKVADLDEIPMWEGDKYFLKPILKGEGFFELTLRYIKDKLIEHKIEKRG